MDRAILKRKEATLFKCLNMRKNTVTVTEKYINEKKGF